MVAILDPLAVLSVRMTTNEYLEADLPEGYRYELVNGEIQVTPAPGISHDDIMGRFTTLLVAYQLQHPKQVAHISFRSALVIPAKESLREPDIAVYSKWELKGDDRKAWKQLLPDLVVEVVSIGGEARDYQEKREDYWVAGVKEYWIVDRNAAVVTTLFRADQEWEEHTFSVKETFECRCLPGLNVDVGHVLGLTTQ